MGEDVIDGDEYAENYNDGITYDERMYNGDMNYDNEVYNDGMTNDDGIYNGSADMFDMSPDSANITK